MVMVMFYVFDSKDKELIEAVRSSNVVKVKKLLKEGANVNVKDLVND
jgi:hypothetical protein